MIPQSFPALVESVTGKGHPSEPLFDPVYSPGSRMPCIDFTPWLIEMMRQKKHGDIVALVARFMGWEEAARGLVRGILTSPLEALIDADAQFFEEFRAAMLMLNHRSVMSDLGRATILSQCLFTHRFRIKPQYQETLFKRLKRFIRENNRQYMAFDATQQHLDFPPDYPKDKDHWGRIFTLHI